MMYDFCILMNGNSYICYINKKDIDVIYENGSNE